MAHDAAVRARMRTLYVAGWGVDRIARERGVSRATLQRWRREEDWDELREQNRRLERSARELALELTVAARASGDPQQAYAAMQAARMAGLAEAQPLQPPPAEVAKALLVVLEEDVELGPILRRKRKEIIGRILDRVERIETAAC